MIQRLFFSSSNTCYPLGCKQDIEYLYRGHCRLYLKSDYIAFLSVPDEGIQETRDAH